MLHKSIVNNFLGTMNLASSYVYSENIGSEGEFRDFNANSAAGSLRPLSDDARTDDDERTYSAKWNGLYSKRDLEFLDAKYDYYLQEYNLDTDHLRDAAKKTCKQSLVYDNVLNDYNKGAASLEDVNKAFKMYDESAKSNMFAACKRSPADVEGGSSYSERTLSLMASGKIEMVQVEWPKDTIDILLDEYYSIAEKLNGDGVFA